MAKNYAFQNVKSFTSVLKTEVTLVSRLLAFAFFMLLGVVQLSAQSTTVPFTTPGLSSFTVPAGVNKITIECWGGGGGGGGIASGTGGAGSGGGGGAYSKTVDYVVTPGQVFTNAITVGATAAGAVSGNNAGADGNPSSFTTICVAAGGKKGNGNSSTGGLGGAVANCTGTVGFIFKGGDGALGGGGGAGSTNVGKPASGKTAGLATSIDGGAGGNQQSGRNPGLPGSNYGGGGGGGITNCCFTGGSAGGQGAQGEVKITYVLTTISSYSPNTNLCTAGGQTITINGTGFTGVTGAAGVQFNGVNAASYNVVSDIRIDAVTAGITAGTIKVTNTGSFATSAAYTVFTSVTPSVSMSANPVNAVTCQNTNITFTASPTANGGAAPQYTFYKGAGVVQAASTTATYSSTTLLSGDVITVSMTSNATCPSPAIVGSSGITVSFPLTVSIARTPTGSQYSGTVLAYTPTVSGATGSVSYTWSAPAAYASPTSGSAATFSTTVTNSTAANITASSVTLNITDAGTGCPASTSDAPVVFPLPTTPSGLTSVCQNTSNTYTSTTTAGASYSAFEWALSPTGVGGAGAINSSTGAVSWSSTYTGAATVSVRALGVSPTLHSAWVPLNVTVYAPPAAPSIGIAETTGQNNNDGITCSGSTVTLTSSTASSYLWSTGATTQAIAPAPTVNTPYTVTITDVNGCKNNATQTITVTANPGQPTATSPQSFCGPSTVANLTTTSGSSIQWYAASGTGSPLASSTALSSTTYYATQTVNFCENTTRLPVVVNVLAAAPTTTPVNICTGQSGSLAVTSSCSTVAQTPQTASGSGGTSEGTSYGGGFSINFPALPPGAVITGITTTITFTANTNFFGDASRANLRVSVTPPATIGGVQTELQPSTAGGAGTVTNAAFGSWGTGSPVGNWQFQFRQTSDQGWTNPDVNINNITITVAYSFAGALWYTGSSGGTQIGGGTSFNPVGVANSGLTNTLTPGTTTYYAACPANTTCRTATNFAISAGPALYAVTGGGTYCTDGIGLPVGLSGSDGSTVSYQLQLNGSNSGSPVTGTNGALTFGNRTGAGTYTVLASNTGCSNVPMNGSVSITALPAAPTTTPVNICAGQSGSLALTSSCNTVAQTPQTASGSGGTSEGTSYGGGFSINFPALPPGAVITGITTTITFTANTGLFGDASRANLRVSVTPPATIGGVQTELQPSTAGGAGTVTNAAFGSWGTGSPVGNWQFQFRQTSDQGWTNPDVNINNITITVAYSFAGALWYTGSSGGTQIGGGTSFNPVGVANSGLTNTLTPGTTAYYAACPDNTTCRTLTNFVITAGPALYTVTGGGNYCSGGSGVAVGLSNSQSSSISYQLQLNGSNTGSPLTGTNAALNFGNQTAAGTYTVLATSSSCSNVPMTGSVAVAIDNVPACATASISPSSGATVCYSGPGAVSSVSWGSVLTATSYDVYFSTNQTDVNNSASAAFKGNQAGLSYATGTLAASTTYYWKAVPRNYCGPAANCSTNSFVTKNVPCSCTPIGSTANGTYISNFTTSNAASNIANSSNGYSAGGYGDYTATISASQALSGTVNFSITIVGGTAGAALWVDWNQNGTFESGERMYNTTGYGNGPFTGIFTVPFTATVGNTRMRVVTDYGNSNPSDPCVNATNYLGTFQGETEDYTFTVLCPSVAGNATLSYSGCAPLLTATGNITSFIWQQSADNSSFSDIAGATNATYNIPSSSSYKYWRIRSSLSGCSDFYSNSVLALAPTVTGGSVIIDQNTTLGNTINIPGDFTINTGVTVIVPQGCPLVINATNITMNGTATINANGAGYTGGAGGSAGTSTNTGTNAGGGGGKGFIGNGPGAGSAGGSNGLTGARTAASGNCITVVCVSSTNGTNDGGGGGGGGGGGTYGATGGAGGAGAKGAFNTGNPAGGSGGVAGAFINGTSTGTDIDLGSGGGGGGGGGGSNTAGGTGNNGGNGGGSVSLIASNNLTVAAGASIFANGSDGGAGGAGGLASGGSYTCTPGVSYNLYCLGITACGAEYDDAGGGGGGAGGGSGGGILIQGFGSVSVTGTLQAKGGNGGTSGAGNSSNIACLGANTGGGAGGGGRIKIFSNPCQTNSIAPTVSISGGNGGTGIVTGASGSAGTYTTNTHPTYAVLSAGTVTTSNQTYCQGGAATNINANVSAGATGSYIYQWYYSSSGSSVTNTTTGSGINTGWSIVGANNQNLASASVNSVITGPGTYRFQRQTQSGSCYAWTAESSVTVTPNNTIVWDNTSGNQTGQTVCQTTGAITAIKYNTTGATGVSSTGLPGGVTAGYASNVITISGTPTASGTFNYTVTMTGGCTGGTNNASGSITVTPVNTIVWDNTSGNQTTQTVCQTTGAITAIKYNTTGATGVSSSGLPAGVTASYASNMITISGTPTASGTFNYTVIMTGGCTGGTNSASGTITVNPTLVPLVTLVDNSSNGNGAAMCDAALITYTATPTNGGSSPTYDFQINNVSQQNSSSNIFTTTAVNNGNTVNVIMTSNAAPCLSTTTATSNTIMAIITTCGYTWTGAGANHNWNNPANWTPALPPNACGSNVNIANVSNYPILTASVSIGDVSLANGATIDLSANTMTTCGNWQGGSANASIVTGTGKIILTGSNTQALSGRTQFQTLNINKSGGSAVMQPNSFFDIFTALELQTGTINATAGTLTLKSTATSHAIFNDFGVPYGSYVGIFTGTIYEERYYSATSANSYNQHYMGSPVSNADLSQFGAGSTSGPVTPTNNCDETQLSYNSIYGAVFSYHQAAGVNCPLGSWAVEAGGHIAIPGQGYSVARTGSGTLTVYGTPNTLSSYQQTGSNSNWQHGTLQHAASNSFNSGWQLVSNPYNATLDFSSVSTAQTGYDLQIQVWDAVQGQYFLASSAHIGNKIAPFQAFFVHRDLTGGSPAYTIDGTKRVVTAQNFYQQNNPEQLTITAVKTGTILIDETTVGFNNNATDQFDGNYDANKITGTIGRHNVYTMNNGYRLNKNVLHSIAQTSTVDVNFEPGTSGSFVFTFDGISSFDPTSYITLEDKKLNIFYDIRSGDYNFTSDTADNWNRFVLHFTPAAEIATTNQNCNVSGSINITQPGTAQWQYAVADGSGNTISSGILNQTTPVIVTAPAGTYTLTLTDANNYTVMKTITVNGTQPVTATATTSTTTPETTDDVTFVNTTPNATTTSWDFGDGTTSTNATETHAYTTAGTYTVTLTVTNADGCSSTITQTITVTQKATTGISTTTNHPSPISIWSNEDRVYIDFTKQLKVEAEIEIYNILGQQIVNEKFGRSTIYSKPIANLEAAYVIVRVKNDDVVTTKRVFIANK